MAKPYLAPFNPDGGTVFLTRFPNGGWTVRQDGEDGRISVMLGAFSNAGDMLDALDTLRSLDDAEDTMMKIITELENK